MNWSRSRLVAVCYFLVAAPVTVLVLSALPQHAAPQTAANEIILGIDPENNLVGGSLGRSVLRQSTEHQHSHWRCHQKIADRHETASRPIHLASSRFTPSETANQGVSLWLPGIPGRILPRAVPAAGRTGRAL